MDTVAIKEEIKQMIDHVEDPAVLEEDIKAGRVYTSEEFRNKVNEHIARYK